MFPVRLVNNLLQVKMKRAGIESARFGVNTTLGVLGFGDPAKSWFDLDAYEEDFGQTLGSYGVGSGFHLVIPLFGPSNVRDAVGMVPDYFLNPINYIGNYKIEAGIKLFDKSNYTSLHIGEYENIKRDAIDFYLFMRNAYEQNRKMKIQE
jgi:phospholipid-binding lipoprotein MlaA